MNQSKGVISRVYRKNKTRPTINAMPTAAHNTTRTTDVRSAFAEPELPNCESVMGRVDAKR
jgi:hypothetical protein